MPNYTDPKGAINYGDIIPANSGQQYADELASRFKTNRDGINLALQNRGPYSNTALYDINDIVVQGGIDYRALKVPVVGVVPGNDPTTWKALGGGDSGGTSLALIDGAGTQQSNVSEITLPEFLFDEDGNPRLLQFFEDGDTIPSGTPVAVVESPPSGPQFNQVTVGEDYTMDGTEDRVDVDTTAGDVMITLPANPSLYHQKPRFTIANIGPNPANMAQIQPNSGSSFALSANPVELAPENSLEFYASKRLNNTYIWSKI